jgi:hypothetical protein
MPGMAAIFGSIYPNIIPRIKYSDFGIKYSNSGIMYSRYSFLFTKLKVYFANLKYACIKNTKHEFQK